MRKLLSAISTFRAVVFVALVNLTWHIKHFLVNYDSPGITSNLLKSEDDPSKNKRRHNLLIPNIPKHNTAERPSYGRGKWYDGPNSSP